jgi:hypothetical protein
MKTFPVLSLMGGDAGATPRIDVQLRELFRCFWK